MASGEVDGPMVDTQHSIAHSVKLIALHLAISPEYLEIMGRSKGELRNTKLAKPWLCNIDLPGKEDTYEDNRKWLKHYSRHSYEPQILAQAAAIYNELPDSLKAHGADRVVAPPPLFDAASGRFREDLFRYHEMRQQLFDTGTRCSQQRYSIMKSETVRGHEGGSSAAPQHVLEKLFRLQEAEAECREALAQTKLEGVVIKRLDELIASHRLQAQPANAEDPLQLHWRAIEKIMEIHGFRPQYVRKEAFPPLERPKNEPRQLLPNPLELDSDLVPVQASMGSLKDHDDRLVTQALPLLQGVDVPRFHSNLRDFLDIKTRLNNLASTQSGHRKGSKKGGVGGKGEVRSTKIEADHLEPAELLHDNIFHAHAFFKLLHSDALSTHVRESMGQIWTRLIAIVAISYGCTSEPALFLTTMDRLLDELRTCIGCHSSMFADTTMGDPSRIVGQVMHAQHGAQYVMLPQTIEGSSLLNEQRHRQGLLLAELARFIHGCVITANTATWQVFGVRDKDRPRIVYQSLTKWKSICAVCGATIQFPSNSDHLDISVGMRDIRAGSSIARSEIPEGEENRNDAYICFSSMIGGFATNIPAPINWSYSHGPFFFYFANLYHPSCKHRREKETSLV